MTIVADETVDPRVRPGSEFRAHLRDPLELGQALVATAGTPARLVVTSKDSAKDGTLRYHIAIIGLNLGLAGELPVQPDATVVERIVAGMPIATKTLAAIAYDEGKIRVAIPLPFKLSNEPPAAGFTPAPLRTAAPVMTRRKPTPTPTAAPSAAPPAGDPSPAASTVAPGVPAPTVAPSGHAPIGPAASE